MSPIDRVSLRSQAYAILGVDPHASYDEIRRAFRDLAFRKHPDQHPDFAEEFARITEAYRTICEHADALGLSKPKTPANRPTTPAPVNRPSVAASETEFDAETLAECRTLLEAEGGPGTLHVATRLYRRGRSLTYFVEGSVLPGRNEVVVPTGMIVDARRVLPRIIAFDSREAPGGTYEMAADIRDKHFPGARSLAIRFASA
jgi:hypothetical protein